jgi:hypothetical protein
MAGCRAVGWAAHRPYCAIAAGTGAGGARGEAQGVSVGTWRALEPKATVGLAEATLLPQTMAHCIVRDAVD